MNHVEERSTTVDALDSLAVQRDGIVQERSDGLIRFGDFLDPGGKDSAG
jgi:hypothetical protein